MGSVFIFCFPGLVPSWKQRQKLEKLLTMDQVLVILGWILFGLVVYVFLGPFAGKSGLTFLQVWLGDGWLPQLLTEESGLDSWNGCCPEWVRVLFLNMVWPLSVSIFRLSGRRIFRNHVFAPSMEGDLPLQRSPPGHSRFFHWSRFVN